jgi:hypothetical protein
VIPSIGFVHSDRSKIPSGNTDNGPELIRKLESFIEKVKRKPVRFFENRHQLALEVTTSFIDLKRNKPRIGFVRTNEVVDYRKYAELLEKVNELKKESSELQLMIAMSNAAGWPADLYELNKSTNQARRTKGFWYHIRVENRTRWSPVREVLIFLMQIEAPDEAGNLKTVWDGTVALGWRHDPNPQPKTIGYSAECDLFHVLKEPLEVRLSPLVRGQVPDIWKGPFNIAVTLQARGIETDSNPLRLLVSWDGNWVDDIEEMRKHFVITPG